jgi:DNA adenine methylase
VGKSGFRRKKMDKHNLVDVAPLVPVAPYLGGKRALSRRLVKLIDAVPHSAYVEPFVGMGGVFLRRRRAPAMEVINDISGDVANMFRVLREHREPLMDLMEGQLTCRADFERLARIDPRDLTDLQRAARFIYLQRVTFGGKITGRSFGITLGGARYNTSKLFPAIQAIGRRMAGVVIEQMDYGRLLSKYDRPSTLFFLDPPYWGNEGDYGAGVFSRADFGVLAQTLAVVAGSFIMTINDKPEVREVFAGFDMHPVGLNYRLSGRPTPARELIITTPGLVPAGSVD